MPTVVFRCMAIAPLTALSAFLPACGPAGLGGRSPAALVIDVLEASSGAAPDRFGHVLFSDVETLVEMDEEGQRVRRATVVADAGRATFRLTLRNPGLPASPLAPSPLNEITVTRYRVRFFRADGRNLPGVDVPHAFDGALTLTVPASGQVAGTFTLVRPQAKLEPPLAALRRGGAARLISAVAEVAFFGRDQAGHEVDAAGLLSVHFGDFDDPR